MGEAGRLLGLLGLPNDTTMGTRSFGIIEERIAVIIRELCNEIIDENLIAKCKLAFAASPTQDHLDFMLWKQSLTDRTIELTESKKSRINCSYDMVWQQRDRDTSSTPSPAMVPGLEASPETLLDWPSSASAAMNALLGRRSNQ
jgi:hypothetical protein